MPPRRVQKLAFPAKGINENFGYEDQPPGTTPDAENVRPHTYGVDSKGRMRGGQRPGLSPYVKDNSGNELKFREAYSGDGAGVGLPIQRLLQIPAAEFDEHLGDGRLFHAGLSKTSATYEDASGNSSQLNAGVINTNEHDALQSRTYNCSAWDSDGSCYVVCVKELNLSGVHWDPAEVGAFDVEIYKFDRVGARQSFAGGHETTSNCTVPCRVISPGRQVLGVAIYNSILYLWVRNVAKSTQTASFSGSFIFRVNCSDGSMVDGNNSPASDTYPAAWADSHSDTTVTTANGRGLLDGCAGIEEVIWTTSSDPSVPSTANATSSISHKVNNLLYSSLGVLYVLTSGARNSLSGSWLFSLDIETSSRIQAHLIHGGRLEPETTAAEYPSTNSVSVEWTVVGVPAEGTIEHDLTGDGGAKVWAVTSINNSAFYSKTDRVSLYEPNRSLSVPETSLDGGVSAKYTGMGNGDSGKADALLSVAHDPVNGILMVSGAQVCGDVSGSLIALDPSTMLPVQYQIGTVAYIGGGSGSEPGPVNDIGILYNSSGFDESQPNYPITVKVGDEVVRVTGLLGDASEEAGRDDVLDCDTRGSCGTTAVSQPKGTPIYRVFSMGPENNTLSCIRATGYDLREDYPGTTFAVGKIGTTNTIRLLSSMNIVRDSSNKISQEGTNSLGLGKNNKVFGSNAGYSFTGELKSPIDDELSLPLAMSAQFVRRETVSPDAGTRSLQLLAVCGGEVALVEKDKFTSRDTSSEARLAVLGRSSMYVSGAFYGANAYFCDGSTYVVWFGTGQFPLAWEASSGNLPLDRMGRAAKLSATWRGRIVLSGISSEPRNWFMSALGDPLNWDYFPAVTLETQAVAGNNSDAGLSGDIINTLIPYSDDLLLFGGDQTIWQMTGDPMSGGRLDLVADITGMAFGDSWCKDPFGTIYFFGSKGGVFRMLPGQKPQMLSHTAIAESLSSLDMDSTRIQLVWNNREMGVHVFLTPYDLGKSQKHYFYDVRTESWWRDSFANTDHNPTSAMAVDGFSANDRTILIGTKKGGVLKWDRGSDTDNGTGIASHVRIGPIRSINPLSSVRLEELEGTLASGSYGILYEVIKESSSESAATSTSALFSGDIRGTTRMVDRRRAVGKELYLKLSGVAGEGPWAIESFSCLYSDLPAPASRRFR